MVQGPSWEANWFAASQEILRISRNPKAHYRTHKRPPPSLSWASPIQSIYPHPISWRSTLILSTHLRLGLPSCLFPSGFPHQDPIQYPLLTHTRHMPSPSHSSRFYHPHNVIYLLGIFCKPWQKTGPYLVTVKKTINNKSRTQVFWRVLLIPEYVSTMKLSSSGKASFIKLLHNYIG